jgi:hypothetical protein
MLGSDLPIERLRSGFEPLYRAYDEIFAGHTPRDREMLLRATAENWYGPGDPDTSPATEVAPAVGRADRFGTATDARCVGQPAPGNR